MWGKTLSRAVTCVYLKQRLYKNMSDVLTIHIDGAKSFSRK
jgi:hypothetical protein